VTSADARATMRPLSSSPSSPRRALAWAAAAIALWSTLAALGLKLRHVPPFLLVGCSLLLGSTLGLGRVRLRAIRPGVLALGVYGLFAYHFCLFVALRWAPALEANLLNYLWPLLIVVLSPVVFRGPPFGRDTWRERFSASLAPRCSSREAGAPPPRPRRPTRGTRSPSRLR